MPNVLLEEITRGEPSTLTKTVTGLTLSLLVTLIKGHLSSWLIYLTANAKNVVIAAAIALFLTPMASPDGHVLVVVGKISVFVNVSFGSELL
ncbi:hypothetical protein N836_05725 [Leptolyngbya sp. Heron Island J]|nr:hypothetical protein N836_05725 [Leptolyngbya sp. Heron Island J]